MKLFTPLVGLLLVAFLGPLTAHAAKSIEKQEREDEKTRKDELTKDTKSVFHEFEKLRYVPDEILEWRRMFFKVVVPHARRDQMNKLVSREQNGHWLDPFNSLAELGFGRAEPLSVFGIFPEGDLQPLEEVLRDDGLMLPMKHSMALDVREDKDKYDLSVEVPGIPKENVDISLENDILSITAKDEGSAVSKGKENGVTWHRQERFGGRQQRSMKLPPGVDKDKITATQKEGVLHVTLPKKEDAKDKTRKINIQ